MPDHLIRSAVFAAAFLASQLTGEAQDVIRRAEAASSSGSALPGVAAAPTGPSAGTPRTALVDPNKKLAVGDQVSIEIVEDGEGPISKIVTATGDLDVFPLERVHVAGKTTTEARAEITRKLEADYYYTATVRLSIDRVNAQATMGKIYVQGEVRQPGVLDIYAGDNLTVQEAILRAGGFLQFADPKKVQVTRTKRGQTLRFEINVKEIQQKGAVEKDIQLEDGDRINVPKTFFKFTN